MTTDTTLVMGERTVARGTAARRIGQGIYRNWNIWEHLDTGRFSISRDGWQARFSFKTYEAAKAQIDAIVG